MTADFDHDEIQDSVFPVEFSDETTALDMYGVWVKSGPRDAPLAAEENSLNNEETPSFSSEVSDFQDISDLPDLPDFTDTESIDDFSLEKMEFDELSPVENEDEAMSFDLIESDHFFEAPTEVTAEVTAETPVEMDGISVNQDDFSDSNTSFSRFEADEFGSDFFDVSMAENQSVETELSVETKLTEDVSIEDIPFEDIPVMEVSEPEDTSISFESFDSIETPKMESAETPLFENSEPFEFDDSPEEEVQLLDSADEIEIPKSEELPSDADFSSFLDNLNSGEITDTAAISSGNAVSSADDLDLDSFISSFNESGGTAHDDKAKVYDDNEPVDLDLDFDESFIADSEKIKATGSAVSESEFFNSEFGVELVDETTAASSDDFDSMFGTPTGSDTEKANIGVKPDSAESSGMEDTDEFNDLLNSLDLAPSPVSASTPKAAPQIHKKTYDLVVTEEDGFDSLSTTVADSSTDDDIDVPLFISDSDTSENTQKKAPIPEFTATVEETGAALSENDYESLKEEKKFTLEPTSAMSDQEFLDIPDIKDYNKSESGLDTDSIVASSMEEPVSLDFDDISAVEQELNDFTPETGDNKVVTNDKSTELLMVIADELSSIKQELSTLKMELAGFKASGFTTDQSAAAGTNDVDNSGFFSDDDTDETIALTGDELNNILITADFTEEKNEDTEIPQEEASFSEADNSESPIEINFSPEMSHGFMESEPDIPETLPDSIFEIHNLDVSVPIEVAHVNKIDDDISYLEGSENSEPSFDDVAIEEPELEIIDFDDEKLEEPELTEFNIDLADIETGYPSEQEIMISPADTADFTIPETLEPSAVSDAVSPDTDDFLVDLNDSEVKTVGKVPEKAPTDTGMAALPVDLKDDIKSVLSYMDQLLESLPEAKIEEFARSEHFEVYKKLFEELGIS